MKNFITNPSLRQAALVAGSGLLAITILAVGAIFFVFQRLVVPADAAATVNNILVGEIYFRIGIASLVIVVVLDVVVAWALYCFLQPVNKHLSMLAAWFRLVYSAIFGVALFNYAKVLQLLGGASYAMGAETSQMYDEVMLATKGFDDGWAIGLVFFGIHLIVLGCVVFKSDYIPKILGVALAIAGAAYVTDSFGRFLLPKHVLSFAEFVGWGEALFMLWLLYKGLTASDPSFRPTPQTARRG